MCNEVSYSRNGCLNRRITSIVFKGVIRTFFRLLKYTYKLSISTKQSRKGVLTLTMWNSTVPISIATLIELIEDIEPIPNYTLTIPLVDSFNYTLLIF
jgi:hypothetical protein